MTEHIYTAELYEQVVPLHGPDPDGLALDYIAAVTSQATEIDDLARDDEQGRPGWGAILDVADCPIKGLPWLAQVAGVSLRDPKTVTVYNLANYSTPQNGSFEVASDLAVWAYTNTTLTRVVGGTVGQYMGHAKANANGTAGISFSVDIGEYASTIWAIDVLNCSRAVRLAVEFQDGSFNPMSTVTETASTATGRRALATRSPAGAEYASFMLLMPSALANETFEVDAAAILTAPGVIGSTGNAYFDGFAVSRLETELEWAAYARDAILRQGGRNRGTPDAILSAAEDTLTGTRGARLLERVGGNPYLLELVTRPSETPFPDATLAAATAQVPAGSKLIHTLTEGVIIDEDSGTIDTAGGTVDNPT